MKRILILSLFYLCTAAFCKEEPLRDSIQKTGIYKNATTIVLTQSHKDELHTHLQRLISFHLVRQLLGEEISPNFSEWAKNIKPLRDDLAELYRHFNSNFFEELLDIFCKKWQLEDIQIIYLK